MEHVPRITDFCICMYVFGFGLSMFTFIIIIIIIIIINWQKCSLFARNLVAVLVTVAI
jgi:hypothetical protein